MAILLVIGCVAIVFAVPAATFLFIISHDPLRIILFVLGSFFWLCSLFFASFVWLAFYPWRDSHIWISLIFTVAFQEVMRVAFFALLKLAENGLTKVSAQGMHIQSVHSLINARHVVALVCGLGFGVMGGLFGVVNILADSRGPGVPGLPDRLNNVLKPLSTSTPYYFLAVSSFSVAAMIILQLSWTVIMWNGLHHLRVLANPQIVARETPREDAFMCYIEIVTTIVTHYIAVFFSLLNEQGYWPIYVVILYSLLIFNGAWALRISGYKPKLRGLRLYKEKLEDADVTGQHAQHSSSNLVTNTGNFELEHFLDPAPNVNPSDSTIRTTVTTTSTPQIQHDTIVRQRNSDNGSPTTINF